MTRESEFIVQVGLVQGELTTAEMVMDGIEVTGWAKLLPAAAPPLQVVITAAGNVAAKLTFTPSQEAEKIPFHYIIPIFAFGHPIHIDLGAYGTDGSNAGEQLKVVESVRALGRIQIESQQDLLRLIQSPSHRMRDPVNLFYTSLIGIHLFPDDYVARSAAVVVMGYRIIEGLIVPLAARQIFDREIAALLSNRPNVARGTWLRWDISLKLVAGYLAFHEGRRAEAAKFFENVSEFAFDLAHWPSVVTNILIGIFLSGWIRYEDGQVAEAAKIWSRAEGVLRYGASVANLGNFYAYGELGNAIKVAQECYVGYLQAINGGEIVSDVGKLPEKYVLDIQHLPALVANLGLKKDSAA